jgi:nucleoside-specific outer membrane channel protein Tsx
MTAFAMGRIQSACLFAFIGFSGANAAAADWSDTSVSWRAGSDFREPFNPNDIRKNIFALTHASGYKYGSNFFNVDLLNSDSKDPGSLTQSGGAHEAYVLYRHTLDIGKLRGADIKFGPVRGVGATFGFDWNSKNDVGYNSRKRMLVAGPTLMWDVPGFFNTSLLVLHEIDLLPYLSLALAALRKGRGFPRCSGYHLLIPSWFLLHRVARMRRRSTG